MKRYKLLKDTPTLKAGTIFEEVVGDFDGLKGLARITPIGAKTSPQFTINDIDNFGEWFEEIHEKHERWRGGRGDSYFKTEAEAESYKKYLTARQVLLDDAEGGKFVPGGDNWYNSYCLCLEAWSTFSTWYYYPGAIYFKSEEALLKSLKEHEEQWEIVRKYEMGEM